MKAPPVRDLCAWFFLLVSAQSVAAADYQIVDLLTARTEANSRSAEWKPAQGIPLEVSGMDWMPDGRLAVAIRKGEVWMVSNPHAKAAEDVRFSLFASGLHEPLGLRVDGDSVLVTQRTELTRLRDTDHDGRADEYLTEAAGWNVSGAYHAYAYGPKRDGRGRDWITLNVDMGERSNNATGWRGWAVVAASGGGIRPMMAGFRSPCGLGANREGDMFCVDQQGNWVPATPVFHLQEGAFALNPEGIGSQNLAGSPLKLPDPVPDKVPYPEALAAVKAMRPPAVWLPYNKMGRSGTDLAVVQANGRFGPYEGQMLVAEFTDAKISRVFLEKVGGAYQGAAFPFLKGFASGIVRLSFSTEGDLFVGMTSRGWSSLGTRAYGLQRVHWNGSTAFAIREMRALSDGFELVFTEPVEPASAADVRSYQMSSYTYLYSGAYGSPEIHAGELGIESATVRGDGLAVRLKVAGMRPLYVHELHARGVRSAAGHSLEYENAYYTLNRVPERL